MSLNCLDNNFIINHKTQTEFNEKSIKSMSQRHISQSSKYFNKPVQLLINPKHPSQSSIEIFLLIIFITQLKQHRSNCRSIKKIINLQSKTHSRNYFKDRDHSLMFGDFSHRIDISYRTTHLLFNIPFSLVFTFTRFLFTLFSSACRNQEDYSLFIVCSPDECFIYYFFAEFRSFCLSLYETDCKSKILARL